MKKFILAIFVTISIYASADEGMWLPSLLSATNIAEMRQLGANFSEKDIYDTANVCFKDAVMSLDHGSCTGELVSPKGLFLTNHHCGYDDIRQLSTTGNNYLRDGFWAKSQDEELPVIGKTVSFLVYTKDVTNKVLNGLGDSISQQIQDDSIISRTIRIEREARTGNHYEAKVEPMFFGNKYFLFVYETFKDIRLVGAPPHSLGKFGGDTDNWMWPRHTCDFSIFRIYTDSIGNPAAYSKDNVPLKSKYFFPISIKGYDNGDFSMVMGFPGSTNRYLTSKGIESRIENTNDTRICMRAEKLRIIREYMETSDSATIQYAAEYAQSSNYYKNSIGQNHELTRLRVIDQKLSDEEKFTEWISKDSIRYNKYKDVISSIKQGYESSNPDAKAWRMTMEAFWYGPEIFMFAYKFKNMASRLSASDNTTQLKLKTLTDDFFKENDIETDLKILASLSQVFANKMPKEYHPKFITEVEKKYDGDYTAWIKSLKKKSIFCDNQKIYNYINKSKPNVIEKDPIWIAASEVLDIYRKAYDSSIRARKTIDENYKLYIRGLMEMDEESDFYSDANSTMRLSYGSVGDYSPADAIHYDYYTTTEGYLEKEIPGDREFDVDPKIKELIINGDFGQYSDSEGNLRTCFISDNDITGGNSGSPVLNNNGELIGIAFDSNWEGMSGDILFQPMLQKCVNVDIRFVLWVIDAYAEAKNIIEEMEIVD